VVGYEDHATAPLGNPAKNFYYGMNEIIRVDDGVVVGIHQLLRIRFGHLHRSAYGTEHLELRRVFLIVRGAVARAGMEYDEHLVLAAGEYLFAEACEQNAVVPVVGFGIPLLELFRLVVFVDVYGRLSPIVAAPYHIHAAAVEIVRKDFVKFVGRLMVENGLHACRGVGRGRICNQCGHAVFLQKRIGRLAVSV